MEATPAGVLLYIVSASRILMEILQISDWDSISEQKSLGNRCQIDSVFPRL